MAEKKLKRLPLGISDFRKIIENKSVYVDKTHLIYQMITSSDYYFLSRPRRFGKSLLISTLAELFAGNKELFKDLWIADSDYSWPKHPIIRFDFSVIGNRTIDDLKTNIHVRLDTIAHEYNINLSHYPTIDSKFQALITHAAKTNKVVILIDEYDKPILDHIENPEEAKAQREVLKSLYSVIKGSDQYLRFVLLTGVSKFAKTSIFSGINNLRDISLSEQYDTLLGYTHNELVHNFTPHLDHLVPTIEPTIEKVVAHITMQYDGYCFAKNGKLMLNPYSVLTCLTEHALGNYWFQTGTPTFLIKLLQKNNYRPEALISPVLNEQSLGSFEPDHIPLSALLFQTGYLTIKDYDRKTNNYTLGIPNREVNSGLTINLADAFTQLSPDESIEYAQLICETFVNNNMTNLQKKLQEFFNRMPYTVHVTDESKLQFVLYAIFALIGVTVDPEVTTSLGRADLIVSFPKLVYVIELKFNKSAQEALVQIQDKKYYEKYENTGKKITLLGINFDSATKTVSLESQPL